MQKSLKQRYQIVGALLVSVRVFSSWNWSSLLLVKNELNLESLWLNRKCLKAECFVFSQLKREADIIINNEIKKITQQLICMDFTEGLSEWLKSVLVRFKTFNLGDYLWWAQRFHIIATAPYHPLVTLNLYISSSFSAERDLWLSKVGNTCIYDGWKFRSIYVPSLVHQG